MRKLEASLGSGLLGIRARKFQAAPTRNPKPQTRNPKPQTLNPKPLNPSLQAWCGNVGSSEGNRKRTRKGICRYLAAAQELLGLWLRFESHDDLIFRNRGLGWRVRIRLKTLRLRVRGLGLQSLVFRASIFPARGRLQKRNTYLGSMYEVIHMHQMSRGDMAHPNPTLIPENPETLNLIP